MPKVTWVGLSLSFALLVGSSTGGQAYSNQGRCGANVSGLGMALLAYHNVYGAFPQNFCSPDGKPLLSWRLHCSRSSKETWNIKNFTWTSLGTARTTASSSTLPSWSLQCPSLKKGKGFSPFLALRGPGTAFDGVHRRTLDDIQDGRATTILLVEVDDDRAVIWTKPDDLDYDPAVPKRPGSAARPLVYQRMCVLCSLCRRLDKARSRDR